MGIEKKMAIKSVVAEKLISYTNENPRASDTSEGIAKWWVKMPLDEVLPALESLVEFGLWEKVRREDRILYRPTHHSTKHFGHAFPDEFAGQENQNQGQENGNGADGTGGKHFFSGQPFEYGN